jgi:hypothetical protein
VPPGERSGILGNEHLCKFADAYIAMVFKGEEGGVEEWCFVKDQ